MIAAVLPEVVTVAPADLDRVRTLYTRGQCLQAYHLAESFGPLRRWDEAPAGRAAEGLRSIDDIAPGGLDDTHPFARALIEALAGVQGATGTRAAFAAARRLLAAAANSCSPLEEDARVVAVAYRAALARLGKDGGPAARLWALWRRLGPLLPAPPHPAGRGGE
ncbi:MAG TPA: hypothetical protein VFW33_19020 [Gemmataceae bacterium]|nr:hypothetical protein [Gemmataceae bacterium]